VKQDRSEQEARSLSSLPIRTHHVLGANGRRFVTLNVFCPRRATTTAVTICEQCSRLDAIDARGECPSVRCDPGAEPSDREPVGTLVRPVTLCVRPDLPMNDLDPDDRTARMIPVVDESQRYIGAIVQGRASSVPPPPDSDAALLRGHATAEDAMEHPPAVNESDDVVTAAATMTSNRARCIAVVNDAGVLVGLLDDLTLLASAARRAW
jgi:CBS domain-containing protein